MQFTHAVEIECTPEQLWPWLTEPEKQKQWMHGVVSNETTGGDGRSVGSTFLMRIKEGRKVSDYEGEITRYDEPSLLAVDLSGGCGKEPMKMSAEYHVTRLDDGSSRLEYIGSYEATGIFMALFGWLGKLMAKSFLKRFFKSLKALAEEDARVSA